MFLVNVLWRKHVGMVSDFGAEGTHEILELDIEGVKNTRKGGLNWVFETKTIFPLCFQRFFSKTFP